MDPLTVSVVAGALNKFLGEAAGEAGRSAWAGLVRLVRTAFPERLAVADAAEQLAPGGTGTAAGSGTVAVPDPGAVIDLSAELVTLAKSDTGFDGALREWLEQARTVSVQGGVTTNVISDGATVHGNVVQARDIGTISFG
jgi:hypothetical protein